VVKEPLPGHSWPPLCCTSAAETSCAHYEPQAACRAANAPAQRARESMYTEVNMSTTNTVAVPTKIEKIVSRSAAGEHVHARICMTQQPPKCSRHNFQDPKNVARRLFPGCDVQRSEKGLGDIHALPGVHVGVQSAWLLPVCDPAGSWHVTAQQQSHGIDWQATPVQHRVTSSRCVSLPGTTIWRRNSVFLIPH
jgi:hypothetical protein